jgi:hypothetical protein
LGPKRTLITVLALFTLAGPGLGCGGTCPDGYDHCAGACVEPLSDHDNCGTCGHACTDTEVCSLGICTAAGCAVGWTDCAGSCYDLNNDILHCGACDGVCGAGQYCSGGLCHSRTGSCPYVFLADGPIDRYDTDLSGSPLAAGLSFFRPAYYGANIYELGGWQAEDGVYRMRLRELIFEASYFDEAVLVVADAPAGYRVLNEWSSTPQLDREPSRRYVTVRDPRPPLTATDDLGRDVRAEVSEADGVPLPVDPSALSRVVLDFGAVAHPERARLVVTTWGVYEDLRGEQLPPYSAGTTIETPDGTGGWVERVVAGKSASDARTWSIDIAGVLAAGDTRMRVTLAHQPSSLDVLDAVLLDDSEQAAIELTPVAPRIAELSFSGASHVEAATVEHSIRAEDLHRPVDPDALLAGDYTRYGDVRPLLAAADDRFVIMSQGDELALEFDEPARRDGMDRWVFLQADVFYTLKYHPFGILTTTIEPLPFHGMTTYPYPPEEWPYRDDADYARYLAEWNTRRIDLP